MIFLPRIGASLLIPPCSLMTHDDRVTVPSVAYLLSESPTKSHRTNYSDTFSEEDGRAYNRAALTNSDCSNAISRARDNQRR